MRTIRKIRNRIYTLLKTLQARGRNIIDTLQKRLEEQEEDNYFI